MPFFLASAADHLGTFAIAIAVVFCAGVYGHIIKSKPLILTAIVLLAGLSLYFVFSGYSHAGTGHYP